MNLKILFMLILYWAVWLMIAGTLAGTILEPIASVDTGSGFNTSDLTEEEYTVGIFGTGVSFLRFVGFVAFGVGITDPTFPDWATLLIGIWQSCITLFTIGFIISSVWNG